MAEERLRRGGGPRGWAWLLFVLVIAAIIYVIVAGISNRRNVAASQSVAANKSASLEQPVNDLPAVTHMNQAGLVGRQAHFSQARVLSTAGKDAFFIGTDPEHKLLVIPHVPAYSNSPGTGQGAASAAEKIEPGDVVNVSGTLKKTPDQRDLMTNFGFSSVEAGETGGQKVYLSASELHPGK